jgi:hypothetical protein
MAKPRFNITMTVFTMKTFTVAADNWQEAIDKASDRADKQGLDTHGSVRVADADGNPIDTFA